MTEYNKLVRDKVVERIEKKGEPCEWHYCPPEQHLERLLQKLVEEAVELQKSKSLDEFADVMEVLDAIRKEMSWNNRIIQPIRNKKMRSHGGFSKMIILERS